MKFLCAFAWGLLDMKKNWVFFGRLVEDEICVVVLPMARRNENVLDFCQRHVNYEILWFLASGAREWKTEGFH